MLFHLLVFSRMKIGYVCGQQITGPLIVTPLLLVQLKKKKRQASGFMKQDISYHFLFWINCYSRI